MSVMIQLVWHTIGIVCLSKKLGLRQV